MWASLHKPVAHANLHLLIAVSACSGPLHFGTASAVAAALTTRRSSPSRGVAATAMPSSSPSPPPPAEETTASAAAPAPAGGFRLTEPSFLESLMPKKEIGVDRFLAAHPEYDGRGALIAIFGYTLVRNSKDLFESFGFKDQPIIIGLIIFQHTIIPIQHLLSFCLNLVSRAFEFQADAFAKNLGYAPQLRAALVKLQEENLSAMNTDPWYSAYHYSHPPLVERLQALEDSDSKKED